MRHLKVILILLLFTTPAYAVTTPKTQAARYQIFRNYTTKLARELGIVEVLCAGNELPSEGTFKFCGVYKGDYFSFAPKWQKYAAIDFTGADRPWIQGGAGSYGGEASARANHSWTFFGDFAQQNSSMAFVSFGMYEGLEEH